MLDDAIQMLGRFAWSLGQAFHIHFPAGLFTVCAVSAVFAVICVRKFPASVEVRQRLPLLLIMPGIWIFLGFWGAAFPYFWGSGLPQNPDWMIWVAEAAVILFLIAWLLLFVLLRGARIVTFFFGLWNLYFVLVMGLIAAMSLSGSWM